MWYIPIMIIYFLLIAVAVAVASIVYCARAWLDMRNEKKQEEWEKEDDW